MFIWFHIVKAKTKNGAGIVFLNPDNDAVLLQRKDGTFPRFPNCLAIIGGAVEPEETPEQAAIREIQEEFEGQLNVQLSFFRTITDERPSVNTIHHHHIFWAIVPKNTIPLADEEF